MKFLGRVQDGILRGVSVGIVEGIPKAIAKRTHGGYPELLEKSQMKSLEVLEGISDAILKGVSGGTFQESQKGSQRELLMEPQKQSQTKLSRLTE